MTSKKQKAIARVTEKVIRGNLNRRQAADRLGVSERTIHNYIRRYLQNGPSALADKRGGHYRKIKPDTEIRIVTCKLDRPSSSARWVRDRLKLAVSVETVRQIFSKHQLNRRNLIPNAGFGGGPTRWQPF